MASSAPVWWQVSVTCGTFPSTPVFALLSGLRGHPSVGCSRKGGPSVHESLGRGLRCGVSWVNELSRPLLSASSGPRLCSVVGSKRAEADLSRAGQRAVRFEAAMWTGERGPIR